MTEQDKWKNKVSGTRIVEIPESELHKLRAEIERLREILGGMADLPTWAEEMGELQREVERLRAELKECQKNLAIWEAPDDRW